MVNVVLHHLQKDYRLRELQEADLTLVLPIENAAQAHPWTAGNFHSSLTSSHQCYLLEDEHKVVAYAVTSTAVDEAELLNITVAPEYQRQGFGRLLLTYISESFNDTINTLFLEVRASNSQAIALYDDLYFNEVGVRPNYYPSKNNSRENAIIMARPLRF